MFHTLIPILSVALTGMNPRNAKAREATVQAAAR